MQNKISTTSNKKTEDSKYQSLIREEEEDKDSKENNVVTKFAFATWVGFIPNNPMKVNQDSFILHPNVV